MPVARVILDLDGSAEGFSGASHWTVDRDVHADFALRMRENGIAATESKFVRCFGKNHHIEDTMP